MQIKVPCTKDFHLGQEGHLHSPKIPPTKQLDPVRDLTVIAVLGPGDKGNRSPGPPTQFNPTSL